MHQQCHQEWCLHQSWCKALLHNPWVGQAVVSGMEVQISLLVSFVGDGGRFGSSIGMRNDASAMTSGFLLLVDKNFILLIMTLQPWTLLI